MASFGALVAYQERLNEARRALPLDHAQKRIVLSELHLYFAGFYQRGYPYRRPTFAVEVRRYHPDDLPDELRAGQADRHSKNQVSDPTYAQAMTLLYGPALVTTYQGEREPVPTEEFKRLARQLPTHLAAAYDLIMVKRGRYVDAPEKLGIGRDTASRYAHQALECLACWIYDGRWFADAEN